MKQLFIDLTSKNCMFNSLEPQGSYLFHRFGKRPIPEEHLDITLLTAYLDKECPDQIILESVFGDPLEYKYLKELLNYCKNNSISIVCVCNGYSKNFKVTQGFDIYFMFKLYAFKESFNTILPESVFDRLENNLVYCNKILYHLYEQNLCDVKNVYDTEKDIEFVKGPLIHDNLNHIITSNGKWLYDVNGLENLDIKELNYKTLVQFKDIKTTINQTMDGYHLLKNYVMPIQGESILDTNIYKVENTVEYKKQISISYKGHIFDSIEERNIITNAYIPDWNVKLFNSKISRDRTIIPILSKFVNQEKLSI